MDEMLNLYVKVFETQDGQVLLHDMSERGVALAFFAAKISQAIKRNNGETCRLKLTKRI